MSDDTINFKVSLAKTELIKLRKKIINVCQTSEWKFDEKIEFDTILKSVSTNIDYKGESSNFTVKKANEQSLSPVIKFNINSDKSSS